MYIYFFPVVFDSENIFHIL